MTVGSKNQGFDPKAAESTREYEYPDGTRYREYVHKVSSPPDGRRMVAVLHKPGTELSDRLRTENPGPGKWRSTPVPCHYSHFVPGGGAEDSVRAEVRESFQKHWGVTGVPREVELTELRTAVVEYEAVSGE